MKKVRYAAGAIGALGMLPATGLAAHAATAATIKPSATTGKSVRLLPRAALTVTCDSKHKHTSSANIRGYISYDSPTGCVGFVQVHRYNGHPTHELARLRFYSPDHSGGPALTWYIPGTINAGNNSILFKSSPNIYSVTMVCEEIVHSSTNHDPVSGISPVCQTTGF